MSLGLDKEADKLKQLGDLDNIHSFWQYDDRVVAPLYGFKNVEDYYTQSSSRQFLPAIKIPTLLIQSKDDPFMLSSVMPMLAELSSSTILEMTDSGGHIGFISGANPLKPQYWLEQRIPEFLVGTLKTNKLCIVRGFSMTRLANAVQF